MAELPVFEIIGTFLDGSDIRLRVTEAHTVGDVRAMVLRESARGRQDVARCVFIFEGKLLNNDSLQLSTFEIGPGAELAIHWEKKQWKIKENTTFVDGPRYTRANMVHRDFRPNAGPNVSPICEEAEVRCIQEGWVGFVLETIDVEVSGIGSHDHPIGSHVNYNIYYLAAPFQESMNSVASPPQSFGWDIEACTKTTTLYYLDDLD